MKGSVLDQDDLFILVIDVDQGSLGGGLVISLTIKDRLICNSIKSKTV